MPARFIGHPLFDSPPDGARLDASATAFGEGSPRIAIMPGSRPAEWEKNFTLLLDVYDALARSHPDCVGVVAATNEHAREVLQGLARAHGGLPQRLSIVVGQTDAVVRWCELALVVSGTVTLQIAKQARPMVAVYRSSRWLYELIGRWVVSTRYFTLPNLIAGREVLPEFVPHFGGPGPVAQAAARLLADPEAMERQRRDLARVIEKFQGQRAAEAAADAIEEMAGLDE